MYNQLIQDESGDHYPFTDWMLFVLYVFSIFLALTSNSIILIIFYKKKKTKSATYVLMSNMAVSDLMSSSFILLQWYFCTANFFHPNQSTNLLVMDNTPIYQFSNRSEPLDSLANLTTDLPATPVSIYLTENASEILQINRAISDHQNTFTNQDSSELNEQNFKINLSIIQQNFSRINLSDEASDQDSHNHVRTGDHHFAEKNSNTSLVWNQSSMPSLELDEKQINLINENAESSIDFFRQNYRSTIAQQTLDNVQYSSAPRDLLKESNRQSLVILENEKRKKRNSDNLQPRKSNTPRNVNSNDQTSSETSFENADKMNSETTKQPNMKERFKNFVNQVINSDKLIKSSFISQMPNCGQRVCAILETLQMSSYYVSTLTMLGIAYNRYILINRPLSPKIDTTLFLVTIWVTSVTMALLASLSSLRVFVFFTPKRFIDCRIILGSNDAWNLRKWRALILMIIQYVLPLSAILVLYVAVIKELKKCGLRRTKHQSSTSSNTMSIDQYLMNRRYTNPAFDYGSMKRNSTFADQPEIFKIGLDKRPEINNNLDKFIDLKLTDSFESVNHSRLACYLKRINLVNLPVVNKLRKQIESTNDLQTKSNFSKFSSNSVKERLSNRLVRVMNRKLINGEFINSSQSSNQSPTASFTKQLTSSQSASAKLNILDDQLDRTKRRLTKMMIVVVILFAAAWFPVHAVHLKQFLIDTYDDPNYCNSSFLYLFFYWMAFSTFCYNPIVYLYFSKELRRDTVLTLRSLFNLFRIKNLLKQTRN